MPPALNLSENIPKEEDLFKFPYHSPRCETAFGPIPRYWYHTPPAKVHHSNEKEGLKAYPIRETEAASAFGKSYKENRYIWMCHERPRYGRHYIIDITRLNNDDLRFTGQAEGHLLHCGDIPSRAIIGVLTTQGNIVLKTGQRKNHTKSSRRRDRKPVTPKLLVIH
jgi:hypothetical protein